MERSLFVTHGGASRSKFSLWPRNQRAFLPKRNEGRLQSRPFVVRATVSVDLKNELERLKAENKALREALADVQGVEPDKVEIPVEYLEPAVLPDLVPDVLPGKVGKPQSLEQSIRWPSPNETPPFWERPARDDVEASAINNGKKIVKVQQDERKLYVVHVTAEMAPIAKVGGLGDVVTGLSRACSARGHRVEVILPYYECLPTDSIEYLEHEMDFDCPKARFWDGEWQQTSLKTAVWKGKIEGVQVFMLRPDWDSTGSNIFRGGRIYGGSYNELEAYLYFCRASLEFLKLTNRSPEIVHVHEWQASAVAMLYWEKYYHDGLNIPRIMVTIHNMDNSGECRQDEFRATGLPGEMFATVDKALDDRTIGHNPERLNLLKGGIVYSNAVTTVSPTYADEILNGGAAGWLRDTLGKSDVRAKFHGVLNGIDVDAWDPSTDPWLPANFTPDDLSGKALCKQYVQKGLGLTVYAKKPLVICITRLVPQKGIQLIRSATYRTAELGGQYVLLGTGHADGDFRGMAAGDFKDHPDVKLLLLYSESLAHLLYAAADVVLVPSMFEPCGLTQMIAMRYGALPVVRRTGGLADTVKDLANAPEGEANGFSFDGADEGSLNGALDRAMDTYFKTPEKWEQISKKNMTIDFSWEQSAASYVDLYNSIASY